MKKVKILLSVALMMVLLVSGSLYARDLNPTPERPVTLRIGTTDKPDSLDVGLEYTMCKIFESIVEANTGGAIQVEVFPSGQLGDLMTMLESVQAGEMQACTGTGGIPSFYPEWQVFSIPYLFKSSDIAVDVMNHSKFMLNLYEDMRKETGMRVLGVAQNGFRHFTNSKRPIRKPEDVQGLKIRVMEGPVYIKMIQALGGTATPIAWTELYTALKTGVVDGEENPISSILLGALAEVQSHLTLDGHLWSENFLVINDDFYNSLPEKYQVVIKEAGSQAALAGTASEHVCSYVVGMEYCIEGGMEIYKPTPAELEAFKNAAQPPVIEWLEDEVGADLVEGMLKAVEESEKKLGY